MVREGECIETTSSKLSVVTGGQLGFRLGLLFENGVSRRGIADALRAMVAARGGVSRRFAEDWIVRLLLLSGVPDDRARLEVGRVANVLVALGDVGHGRLYGEEMLVAVEPAFVEVPGSSTVVLGQASGLTGSAIGPWDPLRRIATDRGLHARGVHDVLGEPPRDDDVGVWANAMASALRGSEGGSVVVPEFPENLRPAVTLFAESWGRQDAAGFSFDAAETLVTWIRPDLTAPSRQAQHETELEDPSQSAVVKAHASARRVVQAGPGAGKTFVACRRAARLIHEGDVAPARLWILSFTRVAVAEIRSRIADYLADARAAAEVNIATFDSFAGRIVNGFAMEERPPAGYDEAIQLALRILLDGDPDVLDFLEGFEHLMVDEAQDLVGHRRKLVEALVGRLPPHCGVTIFGDSAQAIYGFQDGLQGIGAAPDLLADFSARREEFETMFLAKDHRTRSAELRRLFSDAGTLLRGADADEAGAILDHVRERIFEAAVQTVSPDWERRPWSTNDLVLHRSHRALLGSMERLTAAGIGHRVKLPGRPEAVSPWIGAMLGARRPDEEITESEFEAIWREVWPQPEIGLEAGWKRLLDLVGRTDSFLVREVAEALAEGAPLDLLEDCIGRHGPLLGTVHSAKGREADRVLLVLPAPRKWEPDTAPREILEEARILYVGATRACRELLIARQRRSRLHRLSSGRHWRATTDSQAIEVGFEGDVVEASIHESEFESLHERSRLDAILNCVAKRLPCEARREGSTERWTVRVSKEEGSPPIALLGSRLLEDAASLPGRSGVRSLPDRMTGLQVLGASTVVAASGASPRPTLAPLVGGFVTIPRESFEPD